MSIGRTDRGNAGQSTAGQSGRGIQLSLPIRCEPLRKILSTTLATWIHCNTYLLELFVRRELDGAVRYDSNAIDPIPSHETLETLLSPYTNKTSPHSGVLLARVSRLNLSDEAIRLRK